MNGLITVASASAANPTPMAAAKPSLMYIGNHHGKLGHKTRNKADRGVGTTGRPHALQAALGGALPADMQRMNRADAGRFLPAKALFLDRLLEQT